MLFAFLEAYLEIFMGKKRKKKVQCCECTVWLKQKRAYHVADSYYCTGCYDKLPKCFRCGVVLEVGPGEDICIECDNFVSRMYFNPDKENDLSSLPADSSLSRVVEEE